MSSADGVTTLRHALQRSPNLVALPPPIRRYAIQAWAVAAGAKPSARLQVRPKDVETLVAFLSDLHLAVAVEAVAPSPMAYVQFNDAVRAQALSTPRINVFAARTTADALSLARLEASSGNPLKIGEALGYPLCCVHALCNLGEASDSPRLHKNFVAHAIRHSERAIAVCNVWVDQTSLVEIGPVRLIGHYPCRLDCQASAELANEFQQVCYGHAPQWSCALSELLRGTALFWSDEHWAQKFRDEFHGYYWTRSGGDSFHLGHGTPAPWGRLPAQARGIIRSGPQAWLETDYGHVQLDQTGLDDAFFIDWREGRVQTLRAYLDA